MELIKIEERNGEQVVSARDLYEFLELSERFSKWWDRMISYGFTDGVDYTRVQKSTVVNNGAKKEIGDYAIKLSMAKELAMIQRTDKGKQARLYFIECEKKLKEVVQTSQQQRLYERSPQELLSDNAIALNKMFETLKLNIPKELIVSTAIEGTTNMIGYGFPEVKALLNKQDEEEYHSASGLLSRLNIKRNRTNEVLILLGLQQKGTTTMQKYTLTDLGKNYGVERSYVNKGHQGYQILWKETLIDYVKTRINEIPSEWVKYGEDE